MFFLRLWDDLKLLSGALQFHVLAPSRLHEAGRGSCCCLSLSKLQPVKEGS